MDSLYNQFRQLIDQTDSSYLRYLHHDIDWNNRLTGIVGPRGVGKTTLILQHIKLHHSFEEALYINLDDIYFSENKLFDTAKKLYQNGGRFLFIDEIHKYENWSKELKMIYDYFPDFKVVFTGSSILDIFKGAADLSRRAILFHLQGLSFREYLNLSQGLNLPTYSFDEIINNKVTIPDIKHPLPLFKEYLQQGYYPFFKEVFYEERLRNVINATLEIDIPVYANMNISTAKKLKQLLYIISKSVPFKPNFTKLAELIDTHRNQVNDLLFYMEKAGLIMQLRETTTGIRLMGKVEKVFLDNTNLICSMSEGTPDIGNLRETFFFNQMSLKNKVFGSSSSDFTINNYTFEVGGKNKTKQQIRHMKNAFIVKDDIEYGHGNVVPLWSFGFNY